VNELIINQLKDRRIKKALLVDNRSANIDLGFINTSNGEYMKEIDVLQVDSGYIILPHVDESEIIDAYIRQISDIALQKRLIRGKSGGDFSHGFHIEINNRGMYTEWIEFRENLIKKIAKDWCDGNNIRFSIKTKIS
jgi:hypothetical protein